VVENETGYAKYLHGEAVAIGIVMANALAVALGLLAQEEAHRVLNLLQNCGLPTTYTIKDVDAFYEHFFLDKKSNNGRITFILPNGSIGSHCMRSDIEEAVIKRVLGQFGEAS